MEGNQQDQEMNPMQYSASERPNEGDKRPSEKDGYDAGYNESAVITEGTALGQFGASVKKNVTLKIRDGFSCVLEVFIPILFIVGVMGIWFAIPNEDFPAKNFYEAGQSTTVPFISNNFICLNGSAAEPLSGIADCDPTALANGSLICYKNVNNEICMSSGSFTVGNFTGDLYQIAAIAWANFNSPHLGPTAIPDLDQMIMMMIQANEWFPFALSEVYLSTWSGLYRFGKVHLASKNNSLLADFETWAQDTYPLYRYVKGNRYETLDNAFDFTELAENEGTTWGVIELSDEIRQDKFDATLSFNRSGVPWTNRVLNRFVSGGLGEEEFKLYLTSGWLTWQRTVNEFYFNYTNRVAPTLPTVTPMPYIAYTEVTFLQTAGTLVPLLIVFSFLYPVSQQTKRIVEEKEQRIREAMLIMGLGSGSFYASHWVTYTMLYTITSLVASIVLKLTVFPKSGFFVIFFLYFFFCLSCISLATILSAFFSKSRLASLVSPILFFVISIPFFAVDGATTGVLSMMSLLSPSAFAIGVSLIASYEQGNGLGTKEFASTADDLNMATVFFFLIFDTVWYFLVALWLDAILPSEWGTREHCCFCYIRCFKCLCGEDKKGQFHEGVDRDGRDPNGVYEQDPRGKPSVSLRGLRKSFTRGSETFVAVNDLSFDLFEGQISVLLGHNGAGKTTAINLMTGMLDPDAGDCWVYGKSVRDNIQGVRQEIGFCPQHNILWPEMTCKEHLEYFAKLKGLSGAEMDDAVQEMIHAVDLGDKLNVPSGNLSGGQKRKLSVAIAFVGRSRVVFLDEPTAGMDVGARRHTWELIKRMSAGRTIILTTHYMDEADLLGNSISIMSKGRLKCKGSSLFLKSNLGVGYTLNCAIEAAAPVDQIKETVEGNIPNASKLSEVSGEISFQLPMEQVASFPTMLAALENNMQGLGLKSYGISVTTIEEVFLKIGHDEKEQVQQLNGGDAAAAQTAAVPVNEDAWFTKGSPSGPIRQFTTLFVKRIHNVKRDRRTQFFQVLLPILCLLLAMLMSLVRFPESPKIELGPLMYDKVLNEGAIELALSGCPAGFLTQTAEGSDRLIQDRTDSMTNSAEEFSTYLLDTYETHKNDRFVAIRCGNSTDTPTLFHNATARHAAPEALQQYYRAYLREENQNYASEIHNWPMRLSKRESAFVNSITTLIVGIFIMIPFTFIPSTFVGYAVKERECKAKHLQMISGMNPIVYWWANFCFDILSFVGTMLLAIIVFLIFQRDEYVGGGQEFGGIFVLFLFYGMAGVAGAYLCSFPFDSHASAQNVVLLANFISGFVLVLLNYFLVLFESTKSVGEALQFVFRVIPSYCLGEGIINMASRELQASIGNAQGVFAMDVLGYNILYMAIEFPLFMLIVMFLDSPGRQGGTERLSYDPDGKPDPIVGEDSDVAEEREQVEGGRSGDIVSVKNLRKVYNRGASNEKVAVKNLSFGVKKGEVFGFLGTNGAGKTTTISILCGEQIPLTGRAFIDGHDVVTDAAAARQAVGYCPQFDATLDLLNAEEHLRLFAGLRGVDPNDVDNTVNGLIEKAGLTEHRYTLASNMSGGNRRKLSVAISLIGAPAVVFLDEPSAGMDPEARRGLWNTIQAVASKCSVVLTTHHLEEVEALANRVAIMVNGELRCFNTLTNLKTKFGTGFEMSVRIKAEKYADEMRAFIAKHFENAHEEEYRQQKFTFGLPTETKLSLAFGLIEENKEALGISDYSISQTSLEQVFLRIGGDAVKENME